jgi:diguanylate cyclase (GGDEF)-like protein
MADKGFEPELHEYITAGQVPQVLIVFDSKMVRSAIRERLELGKLAVLEASSGEQALQLIEEKLPDLVLLDLVMPGVDGTVVLNNLRDSYSKQELPIIPVTCKDSPSEIVQALNSGANDYITKPIDFDVMWARLCNQLMQKKAAEYLRHAQDSLEQQIRQRTAELNSSNQKLRRVIQEKLLTEDRLQRQANYDDLTGLPNRSLANDRLGQSLAMARRKNLNPCVAFIDLDNFKTVNDTLGHAAGDELLSEAARRLSACARKSDTVARLGGDEFLLILEDSDEQARESRQRDLSCVGDRIIERFSKPFLLDGNEVAVSPSIGFAIYPRDGMDGEELMRHADAAMYRAKKHGKNTCCFYTPEMSTSAKLKAKMESVLRLAVESDKLSIVYQPIVDVRTSQITKVAASLDWHGDLRKVSTEYLTKLADDTGLIVPIGDWMIKTVCAQMKVWREKYHRDICATIHVTGCQLQTDPKFSKKVIDALRAYSLPVESLQLEFPEAVLMHESPTTIRNLDELARHGARMIVNDLGAGNTTLSRLLRYRLDSIKMHCGTLKSDNSSEPVASLGKTIVALANHLGIPVIAQDVETPGDLETVRGLDCRYAQGGYFGRSLPASEFVFLKNDPVGRMPVKKSLTRISRQAPDSPDNALAL